MNTGERGRVDQTSRAQVRLILNDSVIRAKQAVESRLKAIYAKRAARGSLRSGGTVHSVVTALEEIASEFITGSIDRVAPVAKDIEAFAMLREAVESFLRLLAEKVDGTAHLVIGADPDGSGLGPVLKAARDLYGGSRHNLRRQLEIHRFAFTVPQSPAVSKLDRPTTQKNRGGKPLAAHWDDMWAAIAVMLYTGDLKPKTQAEIERAMKDWLAARDLEAGDTAVRGRARKLWHKLKSTE